jgi:transcriptional regulator with XRE-family HTH domain
MTFSIPVSDSGRDDMAHRVARIICGANIPCGELQEFLAYRGVMPRKKPSPQERAAQILIGGRITEARERLGINKQELALAFGVKRQAVQFWERGANLPPADEIPRLCRLLGIDANELLDVRLPPYDAPALRSEILRLAEMGRNGGTKEGTARKVPSKRARPAVRA